MATGTGSIKSSNPVPKSAIRNLVKMAEGSTFTTILRKLVILALFIYFATRVYVAYSKLDAGKIGTLFNRITETTVQVTFNINDIISET